MQIQPNIPRLSQFLLGDTQGPAQLMQCHISKQVVLRCFNPLPPVRREVLG